MRSNANAALHSQVETLKGDREALQAADGARAEPPPLPSHRDLLAARKTLEALHARAEAMKEQGETGDPEGSAMLERAWKVGEPSGESFQSLLNMPALLCGALDPHHE